MARAEGKRKKLGGKCGRKTRRRRTHRRAPRGPLSTGMKDNRWGMSVLTGQPGAISGAACPQGARRWKAASGPRGPSAESNAADLRSSHTSKIPPAYSCICHPLVRAGSAASRDAHGTASGTQADGVGVCGRAASATTGRGKEGISGRLDGYRTGYRTLQEILTHHRRSPPAPPPQPSAQQLQHSAPCAARGWGVRRAPLPLGGEAAAVPGWRGCSNPSRLLLRNYPSLFPVNTSQGLTGLTILAQ